MPVEGGPGALFDPDLRHRMVSEAAYYLYAQRGYTDGFDLDDWLVAEAQVDQLIMNPEHEDTVEASAELGIKFLTLYAFSTENWNRPRTEIDALMSLLVSTIRTELQTLLQNNVRLLTIGVPRFLL